MKHITLSQVVEAAARAETPYILFAEDLALRLRQPVSAVRSAMLADRFGPWMTIDGEPAITRDAFVSHLKVRASQTCPVDRELMRTSPTAGRRAPTNQAATPLSGDEEVRHD